MSKNYPIEVLHWSGMTDDNLPDLKKILIESPELVNSVSNKNDNGLIIASRSNNIAMVKYFIENTNIDINCVGIDGNAFMAAISEGNIEIAKYLLEHSNMNILSINSKEQTPYHLAAYLGLDEIIEILIEKGFDINILNNNHENCLFDFINGYTYHKNYWCFEIIKTHMTKEVIFTSNKNFITIIDYMDYLIESSINPFQKEARIKYFTALKYALN